MSLKIISEQNQQPMSFGTALRWNYKQFKPRFSIKNLFFEKLRLGFELLMFYYV